MLDTEQSEGSMEREERSEEDFGKWINIVSHQLKRQTCFFEAEDGLTNMQKHILHYILLGNIHREIYQRDVEREFQIRRSTATGALQLLEKNGFIRREAIETDARLKRSVPTAKAQDIREMILENIRRMEAQLREGISGEDLAVCGRVLRQMSKNLLGREKKKGV